MPGILVIDDSPSTLETVAMMLAEAGYRVHTYACGKRALQTIERGGFDLILTDIYMPDEDGLEVIQKTRKLWPNLPIVAMSGISGQLCMLRAAKLLGACQLLRKPFSNADLLDAVGAALGTPPPCPATPGERTTPPSRGTGLHE